jgi:hypothetical protein
METVEGEQNEQIADKDAEEDDAKIRYRKLLSTAKESFENGEATCVLTGILDHNCKTGITKIFLFSASRLLRRKIPRTGHLMTPRRLWIQTIPTQVRMVLSVAI